MVAAAAPVFRAALEADIDFERLPGEAPPRGTRDDAAAHFRRLLTLSRRLNSEDSVERILDEVIDTAIELTAAERGFLLLRENGELQPVVGLESSHLSQQLGVLRRANLVVARKEGNQVFYSVASPLMAGLLAAAKELLISSLTSAQSLLADLSEDGRA